MEIIYLKERVKALEEFIGKEFAEFEAWVEQKHASPVVSPVDNVPPQEPNPEADSPVEPAPEAPAEAPSDAVQK